ncbi:MAG TPA: hypothetical protein GXZ60_09245 [Intrasporangiaceae bacterium]|nr:hypothetical protein [Intrasporangiaceae bacterium]
MTWLQRNRSYLIVAAVFWILPTVLAGIAHLTLPRTNRDGRCTGIGFGCTLAPADMALFLWYLAAPILFVAGIVVMLIIGFVRHRRT